MALVISRVLALLLFSALGIIVIKKTKYSRSRKAMLFSFVVSVLLVTLSALVPIENIFLKFSNPKNAYNYSNLGQVELIVDGKLSSFVVAKGSNAYNYNFSIVPKCGNSWKIGSAFDTKIISQRFLDDIVVYIYRYRNSSDYFVSIHNKDCSELLLEDNRGSKFHTLSSSNSATGETVYTYYAYVNNIDDQYKVYEKTPDTPQS